MQSFDIIKDYTQKVCNQIRWKKAHPFVAQEIESHILDQRDAYIAQGEEDLPATQKALLQMGDPITIGAQLDRTHKAKPQWFMLLLTVLLFAIGASVRLFVSDTVPNNIVFSILSLGALGLAYCMDFSIIGKYPRTLYWGTLLCSACMLLFSTHINGRGYWVTKIFAVNLAYLSLVFPLAFVGLIYSLRNKGYGGIILCGIGYLPAVLLLLSVPFITGALLFTICSVILLCTAIAKGWFAVDKKVGLWLVLLPTISTVLGGIACIFMNTNLYQRFSIIFDPTLDPWGSGYMANLTRTLTQNARLIGKGAIPAQYATHLSAMPLFDTDLFLTYLIFTFGWIAFIAIVAIFALFICKGFVLCLKQKSMLGLMVSLSILITFTMQTVLYIVSNLGFQPFAVLSLPLVSYGYTGMLINMLLIGVMLSVFRDGDVKQDKAIQNQNTTQFLSWNDGKLTMDLQKPLSILTQQMNHIRK